MAAHGPVASPEEVDRALTVLAYYGGNCKRAAEELGISRHTVWAWKNRTHADRYLEIAEREAPKLEAIAAQQARETILRANGVEHDLLDRLSDNTNDLSSKELAELAGALQRVTTAKGINTTKLLELTGRPTSIVEHRDPTTTVQSLARKLGIVIHATAEDITQPTTALPSASQPANARNETVSRPAD